MNPIWQIPISLELIKERSVNTMAEHLGIEFTEVGANYLAATMPVDHRTRQPLGLLNGGASCALAETVASTAANYCVDQTKFYCVGLDINANHLRSATQGYVKAVAKPIHIGRRTQVWQIEIFDDTSKLICISRMTAAVIERSLSKIPQKPGA